MPKRVLLFLALFLITLPLLAQQDELGDKSKLLSLFTKNAAAFDELAEGKVKPADSKDTPEIVDTFAKWYVDRVTWYKYVGDGEATAKIIKEFDDKVKKLTQPAAVKNNRDFVDLFGKQLAVNLKEVLEREFLPNRVSSINGAELPPIAAKLKQQDIEDYLVEIIKNPKMHDSVKLYAIRALREYFPAHLFTTLNLPLSQEGREKKDHDVAGIQALTEFISREAPKLTNPHEVDAFRYVRREAIETLAAAQVSAVMALPKQPLEGAVAPTLLLVLQKGKMTPEPTLAEKIEAAIGICQMKCKDQDVLLYNPGPGVYLLGDFFIEFVDSYRADWINFANSANRGKTPPYQPWKIDAERLKNAVDKLVTYTGNPQAKELARIAKENILNPMTASTRGFERIESNSAGEIRSIISMLAPREPVPIYPIFKTPEFQP